MLLTQELVYGHRTVATIAPGIETLDLSRNKQWNDTHLDSDAVQPITIHTQIKTVDSNKPIRRRHDPRHEWHLMGNKQRYNDKYDTVKYCCHQMATLLWLPSWNDAFLLELRWITTGRHLPDITDVCELYVINRIMWKSNQLHQQGLLIVHPCSETWRMAKRAMLCTSFIHWFHFSSDNTCVCYGYVIW